MNATTIWNQGAQLRSKLLKSFRHFLHGWGTTFGRAASGTTFGVLAAAACASPTERPPRPGVGLFTTSQDIGSAALPGQITLKDPRTYVLSGAGSNLWGARDEFHFAYTELVGDVEVAANIDLGAPLGERYRKALVMFRSSTKPDAAYVDVAVHENGVGSLQYRPYTGAPTLDLRSKVNDPKHVRLTRRGAYFAAEFANEAGEKDQLGPIAVTLPDAALVGLGVNSADPAQLARVTFSDVDVR